MKQRMYALYTCKSNSPEVLRSKHLDYASAYAEMLRISSLLVELGGFKPFLQDGEVIKLKCIGRISNNVAMNIREIEIEL